MRATAAFAREVSSAVAPRRGPARAMRLAVMVGVLLAACARQPAPAPAPSTVSVVTVTPRDTPIATEFVAQTQSSREVNIQARVSGFLDRQVYTEGAVVKEGDVLFLMDQKPFQAQLDQARAALQQQEATLENAQANLARIKPLVEQDALSPKDLDDATGQYRGAAAAVAQAQAQVTQAELNLSYATITAPVAGVTGAAQQAEGTYISSANSQLTTVSVLSPMWINFSVSENQYLKFQKRVESGALKVPADGKLFVELVLADGTVYPNKAQITFLQPEYNTKTGTFLIRASVENAKGTLRPNQFVRVHLLGATRPGAIAVPQRAVQQGPKGHFVWVVDKDSKAEMRPVSVGEWIGNDWLVDEGLSAGERVVVDGVLTLSPGVAVRIAEAGPAAAPASGAAH